MRTFETIAALRRFLETPKRSASSIGFVPTMGAFHEGHLSLMRRARADSNVVVVSLFVNPLQFNDPGDLSNYPRDTARDTALALEERVDALFVPDAGEMYGPGFGTQVAVPQLSAPLEGVRRGPDHFRGVATVVAKLFNIVQPTTAYFGQKDAQQVLVIQRMARDLDFPLRIEVCPTVREPDGLAMSSRNVLLAAAAREQATGLKRALDAAEDLIRRGERNPVRVAEEAKRGMAGLDVEYFEIVSPEDLSPVAPIAGRVLVAVAARVGGVRLIDNVIVDPARSERA